MELRLQITGSGDCLCQFLEVKILQTLFFFVGFVFKTFLLIFELEVRRVGFPNRSFRVCVCVSPSWSTGLMEAS